VIAEEETKKGPKWQKVGDEGQFSERSRTPVNQTTITPMNDS